jgi:methyl-accepting chemotaxis protein
MPIDRINSIMTQNGQWQEKGFGESGEIYLIGQDKTLRNESRFFVEDKQGYVNLLKSRGIREAEAIDIKNTSISLQPVKSPGANTALSGRSGFDIFETIAV